MVRGPRARTLPADPRAVAVFLAAEAEAGAAPLTIGRRLAAIGWMHRRAGLQPPQAREGAAAMLEVVAGIRRSHGVAPVRKQAADADVLRDLLRATPGDDLRSVRDRAVLAVGMAGAFRRSELVALQLGRPRARARRAAAHHPPRQDRPGRRRGHHRHPRRPPAPTQGAARGLARPGRDRGRLPVPAADRGRAVTPDPMSDRAVARLVQARAAAAGYAAADFAGHSLRAGFLTAAARSGASVFKMREVSRHKSMQVLADYVRDAELFRDHAGEGFL